MCGLTGLFHPDPDGRIDADMLRRMNGAIAHRGPDGDGFHVEPGVGFGHRRLSIVDVAGGGQPMWNEDETVVIAFNGEIYNFPALRPELQALGHVFRNRCDTEAVIHAWESWGPACLDRLEGMFAFALWDRKKGVLFVARDRLGKKPLYYGYNRSGILCFGSELAALACVPGLASRLDERAVDDFFALGYVPDPGTIYKDVRKLPPASYLLVEHGQRPEPVRYWHLPTTTRDCDEGEAVEALRTLIKDSTRERLMSDVPLGAFLSGGVDSSAVVATAAGLQAEPLATFTIGFAGREDERPLARLVSRRYGTDQHEEEAAPDYVDAARRQARIFGEPFGDTSSVPTEAVCALARRHVTVAISGDGGDEGFAGYRRYRFHMAAEAVRRLLPAGVRRTVLGQLARAYPKMDRAPRWLRAKHTLTELSLDSTLGYYRTVAKVHHDERRALFSDALRSSLEGYDPADRIAAAMDGCDEGDGLLQAQRADVLTYLPGDILVKVDRTSMARSLEVRAPLLDHEVVAWGLSLPTRLKLRDGAGKHLLKKAVEPLLPAEILHRPKQGFATSLATLFREEMPRLKNRLLAPHMSQCGVFNRGTIALLLEEHEEGARDHSGTIWLLLTFEGFLAKEEKDSMAPARAAA